MRLICVRNRVGLSRVFKAIKRPCVMLVNLLKKRTGKLTFCALRRRMASSSDSRDVVDVEETERRGNSSGLIEKSINRVTLLGRVGAQPRDQFIINGKNTWA